MEGFRQISSFSPSEVNVLLSSSTALPVVMMAVLTSHLISTYNVVHYSPLMCSRGKFRLLTSSRQQPSSSLAAQAFSGSSGGSRGGPDEDQIAITFEGARSQKTMALQPTALVKNCPLQTNIHKHLDRET